MPVENGIGYGDLTELKIEHLSKIMSMHLHITQAVLKRVPSYKQIYRYIDLTAGKGFTPDGLKGSPIAFLEQACTPSITTKFQVDLIEQNQGNLRELEANISKLYPSISRQSRLHLHLGNYEAVASSLIGTPDNTELGLIFVDPSGDAPDFETLTYLSRLRPRMEILIYLSTTNIKRVHHLTDKLLSDHMRDIGKQYWLIRKPVPWDTHKWTFLLGSNTEIFKDYKRIDFLRLDSEEAQRFFPKLNLSTKQRQEQSQPSLFPMD